MQEGLYAALGWPPPDSVFAACWPEMDIFPFACVSSNVRCVSVFGEWSLLAPYSLTISSSRIYIYIRASPVFCRPYLRSYICILRFNAIERVGAVAITHLAFVRCVRVSSIWQCQWSRNLFFPLFATEWTKEFVLFQNQHITAVVCIHWKQAPPCPCSWWLSARGRNRSTTTMLNSNTTHTRDAERVVWVDENKH